MWFSLNPSSQKNHGRHDDTSSPPSCTLPSPSSSISSPPSTFLVFSSCLFVPVPVAVQMEVPSTSLKKRILPAATLGALLQRFLSPPFRPTVITVVTYGSASPLSIHKMVILVWVRARVWGFSFQRMSICVRIYANVHLAAALLI